MHGSLRGDPMSAHDCDPIRRESRDDVLRIADYRRFPPTGSDPSPGLGFTRDLSDAGICLGVDAPESIGSLLCVAIRGLDGLAGLGAIHRVVWCSAERDGRYWLGLERISDPNVRWATESSAEAHDLSIA